MKKMTLNDLTVSGLFVGCGGLDYGFQQAGFKHAWSNEWAPDAAESYTALTGNNVVVGDIWEYLDQVPKTDIIVGGPPCQAFSLVGKRLEDDPRAKLVFAFMQTIEKAMPQVFVMENVPGITTSRIDGKRLHIHLAEQFTKMGYEVTILKLTATDFFVPQRRQRVLMIGHRRQGKTFELVSGTEYAKILGNTKLSAPISVSEALDDLPSPAPKGFKGALSYLHAPHSAYTELMRASGLQDVTLQSMPTMSILDAEFVKHIPPGGNYMSIPDSISTRRIQTFKKTGGRTTTYGRLHADKPAYTINTYFNRPNVGANYHHREERLITVREALRLQSFPDHFTPYYKSQRSLHMQVGNAVPPLMARALAESVLNLFRGRK
jgi:DNA (cytosine-5)-methyltransferase 1